MLKIALTGGIASGKSTVLALFAKLGATTVSADEIVHQLLQKPSVISSIVSFLGPTILKEEQIDRKLIAELVFSDDSKLKQLEELLHPLVWAEIQKQYDEKKKKGNSRFFLAEIPLLFETGKEKLFDHVILVSTPEKQALQRFLTRQGNTEKDFFLRHKRLLPLDKKEPLANWVIKNQGDLAELASSVKQIYQEF